jgi:hypothetical protein
MAALAFTGYLFVLFSLDLLLNQNSVRRDLCDQAVNFSCVREVGAGMSRIDDPWQEQLCRSDVESSSRLLGDQKYFNSILHSIGPREFSFGIE